MIHTLGLKASSIYQKQSLRAPPSSIQKGPNQILNQLTMFYPHTWSFRLKTYSTNQQSHNFEAWGWKYGYGGNFPLFLTTSLNFLFLLTVGQSFRPVKPRFPHRIETLEQKPTKLGNILTILNLRGGNMGTRKPSLSSSQLLSISSSR